MYIMAMTNIAASGIRTIILLLLILNLELFLNEQIRAEEVMDLEAELI
jgi:hypothetical protein